MPVFTVTIKISIIISFQHSARTIQQINLIWTSLFSRKTHKAYSDDMYFVLQSMHCTLTKVTCKHSIWSLVISTLWNQHLINNPNSRDNDFISLNWCCLEQIKPHGHLQFELVPSQLHPCRSAKWHILPDATCLSLISIIPACIPLPVLITANISIELTQTLLRTCII